jgi:hypothetical protein
MSTQTSDKTPTNAIIKPLASEEILSEKVHSPFPLRPTMLPPACEGSYFILPSPPLPLFPQRTPLESTRNTNSTHSGISASHLSSSNPRSELPPASHSASSFSAVAHGPPGSVSALVPEGLGKGVRGSLRLGQRRLETMVEESYATRELGWMSG